MLSQNSVYEKFKLSDFSFLRFPLEMKDTEKKFQLNQN